MSTEIRKNGLFKHWYSTKSVNNNLSVSDSIDINKYIKFDSLSQGCEQIKFKYLGVSGVYGASS